MSKSIGLKFNNRIYKIEPDFKTICEIEDELGSLENLLKKILEHSLKISELVIIVHILLQSKGEVVDYLILGNAMLNDGLENYLSVIKEFLNIIIK